MITDGADSPVAAKMLYYLKNPKNHASWARQRQLLNAVQKFVSLIVILMVTTAPTTASVLYLSSRSDLAGLAAGCTAILVLVCKFQ